MTVIALSIAVIIMSPLTLITLFYWARKPGGNNDKSNRINNIVSWWIGLTRPEELGKKYPKFFGNDVMDNIKAVEDSDKENR